MSFLDDFNLLDVEINIPSKDIRDYVLFIAGNPGVGKTTLIKQFQGSFTIDLDRGTKSHAMMSKKVNSWEEVKEITKQFVQTKKMNDKAIKAKNNGEKTVEIKVGKKKVTLPVDDAIKATSKIKFVSIDTINQAKQYVKDYLISQHNSRLLESGKDKTIGTFNEMGWGKDDLLEKELMSVINDLRDNGYGVAMISHVRDKKYNRDTEDEYVKIVPDLQDNERNYLVGSADVEIQIEVEDIVIEKAEKKNGKVIKPAVTKQQQWMYLRANSERAAKSRFAYLPEKIEYGYQNLVEAIEEAVEKEIEYSKGVYGIDDNTVEELKSKQEEGKRKTEEDSFISFLEQEETNEIEEVKQQIQNKIMELKEKYKGDKKIIAVLGENFQNSKTINSVEEGEQIITLLEQY